MKLGFGELLIIFVVILFIVGPDCIPSFAKKIGEGLKAFRNATSDVTKELKENVEIDKSVTDLKRDMASLNSVTKTPVKNTAQVGESEPEGQGVETPPEKKPMKTAHVYDSNLEGDYSPLVPKASAKPKAQPQPQPEAPAGAEAPAEQAPEQE